MNMTIRPLKAEEQKYVYAQSNQLEAQTGSIGYLRGDFGKDGTAFYSTWFDVAASRKTEAFRAELDEVVNALRFDEAYGGLLAGRAAMQKYGAKSPESVLKCRDCHTPQYGFRIDTKDFAYLLRCNPEQDDDNFYCWCFEREHLDRHLMRSREGIRFIDPHYKEKFRIKDGDKIRVTRSDGRQEDRECRYIDSCHLEIESGSSSNLYHILQFAELMERNGSTVIPLRSSLPEQCFSILPSTSKLVLIKRGESGYYPQKVLLHTSEEYQQYADKRNADLQVSKAQEAAMVAGSLFGWDVPAADPKNYDEHGHLKRTARTERGEER